MEGVQSESANVVIKSVGEGCSCCGATTIGVVVGLLFLCYLLKQYFNGGVYQQKKINLKGKFAVITGGNSGIGAQNVKYFVGLGCQVVIGARDKNTAQAVIKECRKAHPDCKVEFIRLDLADRASIAQFASSVPFERIDYLINNAGIMAIPQRKLTKEGVEMQWGINHLGHFYLTYLLWDKIKKAQKFRIVNVASLAHKYIYAFFGEVKVDWDNLNFQKNYDYGLAYGRSKLYNVLFTRALAERIDEKQGKVASLHPGVVRTQLTRQMRSEGLGKFMYYMMNLIMYPLYYLCTKSAWFGCQTNLHCALSDNVQNGCYYADCRRDSENAEVKKQNWDKLWEISEKQLGITFKP